MPLPNGRSDKTPRPVRGLKTHSGLKVHNYRMPTDPLPAIRTLADLVAPMNLGVKFRIYGGFAIVVALAVTLAGFAVWQLGLTQTEVARMGTIADNNARVLQISQTFEVIQRSYLQYKAAADEVQLKQAIGAEQKALSLLGSARAAEPSEERLKIFTALENGIAELRSR